MPIRFVADKDFRGVWGVYDLEREWWAEPGKSRWMTQELAEKAAEKMNQELAEKAAEKMNQERT